MTATATLQAILPEPHQIWKPRPPVSIKGRYIVRVLEADDDFVTYTIIKGEDLQTQTRVRLSTFCSRFEFLAMGGFSQLPDPQVGS